MDFNTTSYSCLSLLISIVSIKDLPMIALAGAVILIIIKFSDFLKALNEINAFFKPKKRKFVISDEEKYLIRGYSGRFGMTFIEITKWLKVIPYNSDGCRFTNPKDKHVVYIISGHFSGLDHDDNLELYINNRTKSYKNSHQSFLLLSSNRSSCYIVDIEDEKIQRKGSADAQQIEYTFKEKDGTKIRVTEKIILYMGTAVRIHFQAPSAKYKNYEELCDYLFSQYFLLGELTAPNSDRVRRNKISE